MSWNAEKEREWRKMPALEQERYDVALRLTQLTGGGSLVECLANAAEIVALLSPMVESELAKSLASVDGADLVGFKRPDPSDPHAALRTSYRPGQKWERMNSTAEVWIDCFLDGTWFEPVWASTTQYRLKEDQS